MGTTTVTVISPTEQTSAISNVGTTPTFEAFFAAHRNGLVRALTLTLGDADLASDAIDEAMTRAVQRWPKVSAYAKPEGWVYRVALNWATSRFRRRKRDRDYAPRIARPDEQFDPGFDPDVQAALDRMSEDHRAVLVLRFLFDWDVTATASALEISPGTVKSRTSRALAAMAEELNEPLTATAGHDASKDPR